MVITIVVIPSLMNCNIPLGHDYIYTMQAMVSSFFWIMMFTHEGHLIIIDQLSHHDPASHISHNGTMPLVAYVDSMHYVSTTTIDVNPIPIECNPIALVPPPHHFGLEFG